jgi:iron complex outermembrane receptor protein/vitamin B12 transporter
MTDFLRPARCILCIFWLLASTAALHAVSVHGTVTDTLGAPIAHAVVALVHNGKVVVAGQTGFDGSYTLVSADSGRFYVLASGHSFRQLQTQSFFGQTLDDVEQNVVLGPASRSLRRRPADR